MLTIKCFRCHQHLEEPGALLFSPPEGARVDKYHLCVACWDEVLFELVIGRSVGAELMEKFPIGTRVVYSRSNGDRLSGVVVNHAVDDPICPLVGVRLDGRAPGSQNFVNPEDLAIEYRLRRRTEPERRAYDAANVRVGSRVYNEHTKNYATVVEVNWQRHNPLKVTRDDGLTDYWPMSKVTLLEA